MTTTSARPTAVAGAATGPGAIRYGAAIQNLLLGAFSLSVIHTIYASASGLEDPEFNVGTPLAWIFYAVAFAVTAIARSDSRLAQYIVTGYLTAIIGIAIFYYPTTFTLEQQTTFGWFENDVYVGLLFTGLILSVFRLARRALVP